MKYFLLIFPLLFSQANAGSILSAINESTFLQYSIDSANNHLIAKSPTVDFYAIYPLGNITLEGKTDTGTTYKKVIVFKTTDGSKSIQLYRDGKLTEKTNRTVDSVKNNEGVKVRTGFLLIIGEYKK